MPTFKIDEKEITVPQGTTVLQAALANGIEIPHYCYHPALRIVGSCRMCLVEIENSPKLMLSCATEAKDGMVVHTQTEQVKDARRSMLEFFLINHPLDCPICDKAGECFLQDYTFRYGTSHSRMVEDKRVRPTKDLGGNILLYRNRCVMCTRCIRFYEDVVGEPHLFVEHRGYHSDISVFPGQGLTHPMTGNIVEICPVGCLIDKDFLFNARVWNLQRRKSICTGCSSGCNIFIEHKDNRIYRIRSRANNAVNKEWICDHGRYSYHRYENLNRPTGPQKRTDQGWQTQTWNEAIEQVAAILLKSERLAVAGSAFATLEENHLLRKIGTAVGTALLPVYVPSPQGEDIVYKSGFTIRGDKSPNRRGATLLFNSSMDLFQAIDNGLVKALVFFGGDVDLNWNEQQKAFLKKLDHLIVLDIQQTAWNDLAHVFWPVACFGETDGTFITATDYVQRFQAALKPAADVKPGFEILTLLLQQIAPQGKKLSAIEILNDLAKAQKELAHISYFKLGDHGLPLDSR
jgi:NADH-quinone oxidoreductase subunit G